MESDIIMIIWERLQIIYGEKQLFYYTYDCGPITQAGSYRFNTTFRSTNFPNTTRSFSTVFTFSAN